MAAQGWDIASPETDAPLGSVAPVIQPKGWDIVGETPIVKPKTLAEQALEVNKANDAGVPHKPGNFDPVRGIKDVASLAATTALGTANIPFDLATRALTGHGNNADFSAVTTPDVAKIGSDLAASPIGQAGHAIKKAAIAAASNIPGIEPGGAENLVGGVGDIAALALGAKGAPEAPEAAAAESTVVPAATAPDEIAKAAGFRIRRSVQNTTTGVAEKPSTIGKVGEVVGGTGTERSENLAHNRPVANGWAATDIGLPRDTVLTPENVAKAEEAPGAVYDRVKGALADRAPVSEETAAALRATNAPDVLGRKLHSEHSGVVSLLSTEPMNASDLMERISTLRQEGYKRTTSAPGGQIDPATEAYGNAQLDAANALEKELNTRVATQAPQLSGGYQAARTLFAKINTVKRALVGYNIDPVKLAKADAKTGSLTGGLGIVAHVNTHFPTEVGLHVPAAAGLTDSVAAAGLSGVPLGATAAIWGHPLAGTALMTAPLVQYGIRKALAATGGTTAAADLDATAGGRLGGFFGRDDSGFSGPPPLDLTPPPGTVMEPHQPSVLRSGENVPVAERGGLPPSLTLAPSEGSAYGAHQPGVLRTGERVPAAESTQTPQPSVRLTPPPGQAFEAHPPVATSSQVAGQPPTAPQYELPLGDTIASGEREPSIDVYHGGKNAFDRFSNEHINTGEGNQNFGHGPYVGTARGVGEHYVPEQGGYLTHGRIAQRVSDNALDLDKPIKDQPKVLKALGVDPKAAVKLNGINPEWTGRELHDALVKGATNAGPRVGKSASESAKGVADWLLAKGVTGTKYLDQVSRKAGTGTHNLVVFDPDEIRVVSHEKLGDRVARGNQTTGGELSAEDLKLAE